MTGEESAAQAGCVPATNAVADQLYLAAETDLGTVPATSSAALAHGARLGADDRLR